MPFSGLPGSSGSQPGQLELGALGAPSGVTSTRSVPVSAVLQQTGSRSIPATAQFPVSLRVTQTPLEVPLIGTPNLRVSQTALEVVLSGTPALRVTQTPLEVVIQWRSRFVPVTALLEKGKRIPISAVFRQATVSKTWVSQLGLQYTQLGADPFGLGIGAQARTGSRLVPATAVLTMAAIVTSAPVEVALTGSPPARVTSAPVEVALSGTASAIVTSAPVEIVVRRQQTRSVLVSAAFEQTRTRSVPATARFAPSTFARTVPASAQLAVYRTVPITARFESTQQRIVRALTIIAPPGYVFHLLRRVPVSAEFEGGVRHVPATAWFSSQHRVVPVSASIGLRREIPVSAIFQPFPRLVPVTASIGRWREVPATWMAARTNARPVHANAALYIAGYVPVTVPFIALRRLVPCKVSLWMSPVVGTRLVTPSDHTLWTPVPGSPNCVSIITLKSSPDNTVAASQASRLFDGIIQYTGFPIGPYVLWDPPEAIPGDIPPDWNFPDFDQSQWQVPLARSGSPIPWPTGSSDLQGLNFNWGPDSPTDANRSWLRFPYVPLDTEQWTDPWDDVVMFRALLGLPDDPELVSRLTAQINVAETGYINRIFQVTLNGLDLPFVSYDGLYDPEAQLMGTWNIPAGWFRPGDNVFGIVTGSYMSWPLEYFSRLTSFRLNLTYCSPRRPYRPYGQAIG